MGRVWRDAVALRVAGIYLIASVVWIVLSDQILDLAVADRAAVTLIQSYKGIAFVILTSVVLLVLVHRYVDRLAGINDRLLAAYDETLAGWAAALDIRDRSTAQHTQRVTALTVALAASLGVDVPELVDIRRGATLHDIGKMGVPDSIVTKTGPLDDREWVLMRRHPELAVEMLKDIEYLRPCLAIPWCHHEWWDGTGYPRGLAGEEIPFEARLFAVVDVYDALTSVRPYRDPMASADAIAHIRSESGTHFDPVAVDAFCRLHAADVEPTGRS